MKRRLFSILFIAGLLFFAAPVARADQSVDAYFFWRDGCPHCEKESKFLQMMEQEYPNVNIQEFEVSLNSDNAALLQRVSNTLKVKVLGVPFLVIGDQAFTGYSEVGIPEQIEQRIQTCSDEACPDSIKALLQPTTDGATSADPATQPDAQPDDRSDLAEHVITLPLLGTINVKQFSLPTLAVVMGFFDGFNPCAMWALLFLISLLLEIKNRKKMWVLGTTFIIASAAVYFFFMSAWLNLVLFLGFILWVRLLIGVVALLGGSYSIKEFIRNKNNTCKVVTSNRRRHVFEKLKTIVQQKSFIIAFGGIILLAFMVNMVELFCSAGLPAVFTQVLAINKLPNWSYYFYILLYVFFFMLDDLIVFFAAMMTLRMTGITTKYAKYSRLVGGVLMIIIGLLLIFKPEWLLFG
jgi:glutaredoxin